MKDLHICTILKELRKEHKLSKELVSEITDVNPSTYYRWESGATKIPFEAVIKLASYYDVDINFFVGGDRKLPASPSITESKIDALTAHLQELKQTNVTQLQGPKEPTSNVASIYDPEILIIAERLQKSTTKAKTQLIKESLTALDHMDKIQEDEDAAGSKKLNKATQQKA